MNQNIKNKLVQILEYSNGNPGILLDDIFARHISIGGNTRNSEKRIVGFCAKYAKSEAINKIKEEYGLGGGTVDNICLDTKSNLRFCSHCSSDSKGITANFIVHSDNDEILTYFLDNLNSTNSSITEENYLGYTNGYSKVYSWSQVYDEIIQQIENGIYMDRIDMDQICKDLGIKNPFSFKEDCDVQLSLFDIFEDEAVINEKPSLSDILKSIDVERKKFVTSHDSDCHGKNKLKEIER